MPRVGNKGSFAERFALQARIPYVRLLDATGGSVKTFEKIGRTYLPGNAGTFLSAELLQRVPVVSAVLGSVAGLPAVQACLCHFNVMVRNTSQVFVAGPKVVEQATGRTITKEDLGDERIQVKNGVVMNLAEDEADAIGQVRRFLSYLPANVWEAAPVAAAEDDPNRREESLLSVVPRQRRTIYDPHRVLDAVLDKDSFFEIGPYYGRARVTGLARVDGHPVGVMANHPKFNGGSMDIAAGGEDHPSDRTVRHLPPAAGLLRRRAGLLRGAAPGGTRHRPRWRPRRHHADAEQDALRLLRAAPALRVAGGLHQRGGDALYRRYCWPSTHGGSMHIEGGAAIAYKRDIESAPDPEAKREEIEARLQAISSPFRNAHAFGIEEIIDPRDTRPLLVDFVEDAWRVVKTQLGPNAGLSYRP